MRSLKHTVPRPRYLETSFFCPSVVPITSPGNFEFNGIIGTADSQFY